MNILLKDKKINSPVIHGKNGLVYVSDPVLDRIPWLVNGTSTRLGGASEGFCATMNMSLFERDTAENVTENHRRFGETLGFDNSKIVKGQQKHTNNVSVVLDNHRFRSMCGAGYDFECTDGMITNISGVVLEVVTADCVPVSLVDPVHKAIGLCHSGWRGTHGKISQVALKMMNECYGTNPEDVIATLGPSICKDCFEVEYDLIEAFSEVFDEDTIKSLYIHVNGPKYRFDLWKANELLLEEAGVKKENVSLPNVCTCCNPDVFFSYRTMKQKCPTIATILSIKE